MKFNYKLSDKIKKFIENSDLEEINIGCSDSQVIRINDNDKIYYLKIAKKGLLSSEHDKLVWLEKRLNVPKVILYDVSDEIEYLITSSCNGKMVCNDYYIKNPEIGIKVIAQAFNKIYSVDISDCPFDVGIQYKLSLVEKNINDDLIKLEDIKETTIKRFGSLDNILSFLKENKFECKKCFSHGDTSLPNIFAIENQFEGFIDVGECGIADKWFDLAICEKSIRRNYGEEYILRLYDELNIIPDREKIDYYLLMMELYL